MLRLALFDKGAGGEAGVRAAAAVEALDLYVAGCRPVDLDARSLRVRGGRRGDLPRGELAESAAGLPGVRLRADDAGPRRWHCTLTRHKRWPEIDLITYAAPERARGNE
ncbi:hypothetical protein JL720_7711 [Aureococcus anophagefferens]|nr:hypothetical protein JL720_7711 [Aureococcus anophagefferens]